MKCRDMEFGTGMCAYNIMLPYLVGLEGQPKTETKIVSIDKCLLPEILKIWELGIRTTGCCCGHGAHRPFIGVREEYSDKMIKLGYEMCKISQMEKDLCLFKDMGYFIPKTKFDYNNAEKGFNWWDNK